MDEVTISCHANRDGRRSIGVSVGREDYFDWEFGADPTPDEFDPRLDWSIDLRAPSDHPLEDEGAVALWYRNHRAALADVAREVAGRLALGITDDIAGWAGDFSRPWGTVRVVISVTDSVHAGRVAEYLAEFADAGLRPIAPRPLAVGEAIAAADWAARQSEV